MMVNTPIALFVFKRLEHTQKTILSLMNNPESVNSVLFIFSDAPKYANEEKSVEAVRKYIKRIKGFKSLEIFERDKNLGLSNSIISGVSQLLNLYESLIILEDDLVVSPFFLNYMNSALELYKYDPDVISIHGYVYPVKQKLPETFFLRGADCWGWATWKRAWELSEGSFGFEHDGRKLLDELKRKNLLRSFDLDGTVNNVRMLKRQIAGKVDSWAIRWHASAYITNKFTLYPSRSLVKNIGADLSGSNLISTKRFDVELSEKPISLTRIEILENLIAKEAIKKYFTKTRPSVLNKLTIAAKNLFRKNLFVHEVK
jgi:hypothetical protein